LFIRELDALDAAFQARKLDRGFGRDEVVGFVFSGDFGCRWLFAGFENANRLLGRLGGSFFLGFLSSTSFSASSAAFFLPDMILKMSRMLQMVTTIQALRSMICD
jgi:hypothetical protein